MSAMSRDGDSRPISNVIRDQAIAWFTLAQSGCMSEAEQRQLLLWREADSEHERAWQRLSSIPLGLQRHAGRLADPLLRQLAGRRHYDEMDRRKALKVLVGFGLLGGLAWQGRDTPWVQGAMADYHTATGERTQRTLPDGTQLWLNTATAVDLHYTDNVRELRLRYGEIEILTARDSAGRPLRVVSGDAVLQPLGTRFRVRREHDGRGTLLAVTQGRVAASSLAGGEARVIEAGSQARIGAAGVSAPQALDVNDGAWVDGYLVAERMRLADFLAELDRYRPGLLRCDPAVAGIRLSGSYPLGDTDQVLAMLQDSLPVTIQRRTRYWVTVGRR
ncbi:FecR domain-containing protein [Pseudomonas sp. PDM23]|uniref:FecR domain-containing protein n=2 Tax=unclassified Pseudomonas TaxID=196821 RepID=UPI0017800137|nr:FecR domain-containing protein [Pseudomonas sp. PDM21]MBD9578353.1 FecR domain-containing protein [Pseudomonas sp. PDM23]MBD9673552.1 FecR domain-containing protein [Pseudomonas sp. PDM21]